MIVSLSSLIHLKVRPGSAFARTIFTVDPILLEIWGHPDLNTNLETQTVISENVVTIISRVARVAQRFTAVVRFRYPARAIYELSFVWCLVLSLATRVFIRGSRDLFFTSGVAVSTTRWAVSRLPWMLKATLLFERQTHGQARNK